ncbi:hypothetical protein TWF970_005547 [Orbilia oligospora]|uniref:LysM domain-containing protein n=1 Tax=Orbilia oligospora TaxID=2813651 RepID=A0A7C8VQ90_ORBOL|nr:hypothetical protein TWF970_005547 [Orbilia oligospora]
MRYHFLLWATALGFRSVLAELGYSSSPLHKRQDSCDGSKEPDIAPNCDECIIAYPGDTCEVLADIGFISVDQIKAYNPALERDCSDVEPYWRYCIHTGIIASTTTTTKTSSSVTSTTQVSTNTLSTPSPLITGGVVPNCDWFYKTPVAGYNCRIVVSANNGPLNVPGLSIKNLEDWNYGIAPFCEANLALPSNVYVCIRTIGYKPPTTTTTTTASSSTTPSSTTTGLPAGFSTDYPVQILAGQVHDCNTWYLVATGDTINSIYSKAPTIVFPPHLLAWNPTLGPSGTGLTVGTWVCVSRDGTNPHATMPTTTTTTTTTTTKTTTTSVKTTTKATTTPTKTTTTTKTTTALTHPIYQPSQFPMTKTVGCISASNQDPTPISFYAGDGLYTAISSACKTLVGTSAKYLETGLPYVSPQLPNGKPVLIDLQIRKGGFSVTNAMCYDQLVLVLRGCRSGDPSRTFGGCSYTSDYNLEACIFPDH